ncbi:MAG: indolepyruvate oxidoreductase subunit beta [Clostridia bacterium]|nr:indolepyruvate oxidoreductase subunit beta [Clostridia bacterium]
MTINGKTSLDIVLAGVGGQGTLVAGRILGALAQALGLDAKVSEVHGMSQRGGSVITYARLGEKVHSPILERGQADFLLAFEELEALRWAGLLRRDGAALISTQRVTPLPVSLGTATYPEDIPERLENACGSHARVVRVDAPGLAAQAGSARAVNVVMLGAMAAMTDVPVEAWHDAIDHVLAERLRAVNHEAFRLGYGVPSRGLL